MESKLPLPTAPAINPKPFLIVQASPVFERVPKPLVLNTNVERRQPNMKKSTIAQFVIAIFVAASIASAVAYLAAQKTISHRRTLIQQAGASPRFDDATGADLYNPYLQHINSDREYNACKVLKALILIRGVRAIFLDRVSFSYECLSELKSAPDLEVLSLEMLALTDRTLQLLGKLENLKYLSLAQCIYVTPSSCSYLATLGELQVLKLPPWDASPTTLEKVLGLTNVLQKLKRIYVSSESFAALLRQRLKKQRSSIEVLVY